MIFEKLTVTKFMERKGSPFRGLVYASLRLDGGGTINLRNIKIMKSAKGAGFYVSLPFNEGGKKDDKKEKHYSFSAKEQKSFFEQILDAFKKVPVTPFKKKEKK